MTARTPGSRFRACAIGLALGAPLAMLLATDAVADSVRVRPEGAGDSTISERAELTLHPKGKPFKTVTIDNPLGDVRVEGYDGSAIKIETIKYGPNEEALDRLRISLVPNPDGTVKISTTADGGREFKPLGRNAVRIDLLVRAPRNARVEATSMAGALDLHNMDNGGELDSASGRINVRNVSGELSTHSVSGPTSLVQVFGSVDAQTLSSGIDLDTINGEKLVASANDGKIAGRRVRSRNVEVTTVNGKIELEGETSLRGRLIVASMNGDINVRMRRNGGLIVRARGAKINFGATPTRAQTDGWVEAQLGQLNTPALIEMRSRIGMVSFAIIE